MRGALFAFILRELFEQLEVDALLADLDDLHFDHIADREHVFNGIDAAVCHLGDVDHAVLPGCELDERPHLGEDAHDVADEHIAHFGLVHDGLDDRLRALCGLGIAVGSDAHGAVVLDVDLGARLRDDGVDDLALLADDVADLLVYDKLTPNCQWVNIGRYMVHSVDWRQKIVSAY